MRVVTLDLGAAKFLHHPFVFLLEVRLLLKLFDRVR